MIVNAKRKELFSQAKKAAKAAPAEHTLRELSGIHLVADDRAGVIRMTGTNLETAIRSTMPAAVERAGNAVINAALFLDILEKLPGEDAYMELRSNDVMFIRSGTAEYFISVMQSSNYPKIDIPFPGDTVSVKGLKSLINRSLFSVKTDSPKTVYHCLKFVIGEDGLRVIGSNGFCAVQLKGDPECVGNISMLIPASSLKMLAAIADDNDVFELGVMGSNGDIKTAVFSDGTTLFSARLMEGEFVDTDKLFSGIEPVTSVRLSADKLRSALDLAAGLHSEHGGVEISVGSGGLDLRSEAEHGSFVSHIDAMIDNAANAQYYYISKNLLGCSRSLKGEVTLCFSKNKLLAVYGGDIRYIQSGAKPGTKVPADEKTAA